MTGREFARRTGWPWRTIAGWVLRDLFLGHWAWSRLDFVLDEEMAQIMLDFKTRYEAGRTGAQVTADQLGILIGPRS